MHTRALCRPSRLISGSVPCKLEWGSNNLIRRLFLDFLNCSNVDSKTSHFPGLRLLLPFNRCVFHKCQLLEKVPSASHGGVITRLGQDKQWFGLDLSGGLVLVWLRLLLDKLKLKPIQQLCNIQNIYIKIIFVCLWILWWKISFRGEQIINDSHKVVSM